MVSLRIFIQCIIALWFAELHMMALPHPPNASCSGTRLPKTQEVPNCPNVNTNCTMTKNGKTFYFWVLVGILGPNQSIMVMSCLSVYLITLLLDKFSPLSGLPVLCTYLRQKLTTALLESAEMVAGP